MKKIVVALVTFLGVFFISSGVVKAETDTWRIDYLDIDDSTGNTKIAESDVLEIENGTILTIDDPDNFTLDSTPVVGKTIDGYELVDSNFNESDPDWYFEEPHGPNTYIVVQLWYRKKTYNIQVDYLDWEDPSIKVAESVTFSVKGNETFTLPYASVEGYHVQEYYKGYETETHVNPTYEVYQVFYEKDGTVTSSETTESTTSATATSSSTSESTVTPTTEKTQKALPQTGEYVAIGLPIIGLMLVVGTLIWSKKRPAR